MFKNLKIVSSVCKLYYCINVVIYYDYFLGCVAQYCESLLSGIAMKDLECKLEMP